MADAQSRGWGAPCSVATVTLVRNDGLRLPVHAELADLTTMLLDLTEMAGYDVLPGQTWGKACRKISGTNTWSNHSWALADDINAPANPYASVDWHRRNARGTRPFGLALVCDIPQSVIEMWEAHGYRWGGRYKTKPDPMHFEFMGTPADARAHTQRLRDYLAGHGNPAPPPPAPAPAPPSTTPEYAMDTLDLRNAHTTVVTGRHVDNLQALLIATWAAIPAIHPHLGKMMNGYGLPDGKAGAGTKAALIVFQKHVGLNAVGYCGAATWKALIEF